MRDKETTQKIPIPEGVTVKVDGSLVDVSGPKGQVSREFRWPSITVKSVDGSLVIETKKATKRELKMAFTFTAHFKNMLLGVTEGHQYKLKVCSGHFPMTAAVTGNTFTVKNFLGEKVPRVCAIRDGASVKVDGDIVTVDAVDIESAGQTAANIEQLTRITNRDLRIFQDGIYMINKAGKELN